MSEQTETQATETKEPLPPVGSGIDEDVAVAIPAALLLGFCRFGMMLGTNVKNKTAKVCIMSLAQKVVAAADVEYRRVPVGQDPGAWFLAAMTQTANMLVDKLIEQHNTKLLTPSKKLVVAGS